MLPVYAGPKPSTQHQHSTAPSDQGTTPRQDTDSGGTDYLFGLYVDLLTQNFFVGFNNTFVVIMSETIKTGMKNWHHEYMAWSSGQCRS